MSSHETIMKLIPEEETAYSIGEISCFCDGKKMAVVPTEKRLMTCTNRFWGLYKVVDDFGWGKFDHARITQKFGNFTIELRFRGGNGSLKLDKINRDQFDILYRRIRERITKYDEKYKLSSRICPHCGETINYRAKECPHCHHELQGNQPLR